MSASNNSSVWAKQMATLFERINECLKNDDHKKLLAEMSEQQKTSKSLPKEYKIWVSNLDQKDKSHVSYSNHRALRVKQVGTQRQWLAHIVHDDSPRKKKKQPK